MQQIRSWHIALLAALLLAGGVWALWPSQTPADQTPASPGTSAGSVGPSSGPASGTTRRPSPPNLAGQRQLVADFATVFASRVPRRRWLSDLQPYVTSDLLEGLRYTDPRLRPRGPVEDIRTASDDQQAFVITYPNRARVRCTLARVRGGWVVAGIEPVELPDGAPA